VKYSKGVDKGSKMIISTMQAFIAFIPQ